MDFRCALSRAGFAAVFAIVVLSVMLLPGRTLLADVVDGWDGPGQGSASLTYHFVNYASSIADQEAQRVAIRRAMDLWATYANISFTQTSTADLNNSLNFGFYSIFDGPGGTRGLGYAPPPATAETLAGDVKFDATEDWSLTYNSGINLYSIALREVGRALGLSDNSSDTKSVMYPTFYGGSFGNALCQSDIDAIQAIYGAKTPRLTANVWGTHTYRSDLIIKLGVRNPAGTTLWETDLLLQAGGSNDHFDFSDINLWPVRDYLNGQNDWYVKITDSFSGDTGTLQGFNIMFDGVVLKEMIGTKSITDGSTFSPGTTYAWFYDVDPVPEPATLGMLGLGAVYFAWGHARRAGRKLRIR